MRGEYQPRLLAIAEPLQAHIAGLIQDDVAFVSRLQLLRVMDRDAVEVRVLGHGPPRLSHTPVRIVAISAGDLSGNAAARLARPMRCSGSHGPTIRISPPKKFAMRLRSMQRTIQNTPTVTPPRRRYLSCRSIKAEFRVCAIASQTPKKRHDDFHEHLVPSSVTMLSLESNRGHEIISRRRGECGRRRRTACADNAQNE